MAWQLDNTLTPTYSTRSRLQGGGGGDRSLRLEDMEHLAAQSTLLEGTPSGLASSQALYSPMSALRAWCPD